MEIVINWFAWQIGKRSKRFRLWYYKSQRGRGPLGDCDRNKRQPPATLDPNLNKRYGKVDMDEIIRSLGQKL
jgi:hypothetical protein